MSPLPSPTMSPSPTILLNLNFSRISKFSELQHFFSVLVIENKVKWIVF